MTNPPVAVLVSQEDGATITDGLSATVSVVADDSAKCDGISMSTPHVAGVAALVFGAAGTGTVSVTNLRNALISTGEVISTDQPIGRLVRADAAVNLVHP